MNGSKSHDSKSANGRFKHDGRDVIAVLTANQPTKQNGKSNGRSGGSLAAGGKRNGHNGHTVVAPVGPRTRIPAPLQTRRIKPLVHSDRILIERCLAGDVSAWSEIYHEFHDSLLSSIRRYLSRARRDVDLVEEIAARVWYALIKNDFELLSQFDVERGCRLSTYLSVVAKNEARVLFRTERRRRTREHLASRPDICDEPRVQANQLLSNEEFLVTLTKAELAYFLDVLIATPENRQTAEQAYSTENNWQLRHRIRKKLEHFMSERDS